MIMAEYVEREKVLSKAAPVAGCFSYMISAYDVIMLPTADVAPVRHGRWIKYQIPPIICCSNCDWATDVEEKNFQYCPNCGAKMDGELNE